MDVLKELTYIVNDSKIDKIEVLSKTDNTQVKYWEMFKGVLSGDINSDEQASLLLFPVAKNGSTYRKFKLAYKRLLINTLFFVDINKPSYSQRQKAYYECYREWAAAKILFGKNARKSSVHLTESILKYSIKYEFSSLVFDIVRTLRLHYGTREGSVKKYTKYNELYHKYREITEWEGKVEEYYANLIIGHVNKNAIHQNISEEAMRYYQEIREAINRLATYNLQLYGGLIELMIYSEKNDYAGTLTICDKLIANFEAKKYLARVPLQIWHYQKLLSYIQLNEFEKGKITALQCLTFIEEGSFNWFKYMELYFTLIMHTQKYEQAVDVYFKAVKHRRFQFLPDQNKEVWKLYRAYLHYIKELDLIDTTTKNKYFTTFRLNRFLNDVPLFSMDKRGMNIAVLTIQIMFLILFKKYNQAIDRIEAIERYVSRYLNQGDVIRSKYFIKMLLQIPLSSFNKTATLRKTAPYFEKLKAISLSIANQTHKIEIIRYEILWDMVINTLDKKTHYREKR